MAESTTVLKTDVLGRVRIGKAHREALLDAFEAGGTSGAAFARAHGVNYQTFASWLQKRKRVHGRYPVAATSPGKFMALTLAEIELPASPVAVASSTPTGLPVEIALPGGLVVRVGGDASLSSVVELVKALRSC